MPRPVLNLTPEQRAAALAKAAVAKAEKKKLLDDVRSGKRPAADLLSEESMQDPRVQKLQVITVLRATPGINPAKVRGIMEDLGIDDGRRIQGLGVRQHAALVEYLSR